MSEKRKPETNLDIIEAFIDKTIMDFKEEHGEDPIIRDKIAHIIRVIEIASREWPDDQLVRVAAKIHDIGRFPQYKILGKFDDGIVLHHYLGEDFITRALYQGKVKDCPELDRLRAVIKYHGRTQFLPFKETIPVEAQDLVDKIGRVDGIENGCIGAVGYLVREAEDDAKSYRKNSPDLDMKSISPEVLEFFKKGEKFDKMKYCKTYADYTLFAAVLAITALKGKDRNMALDAMKNYKCSRPVKNKDGSIEMREYSSALEGYDDIFTKLLHPRDKAVCRQVLNGFYQDPNYEYTEKTPEEP